LTSSSSSRIRVASTLVTPGRDPASIQPDGPSPATSPANTRSSPQPT
jgi:hypothetical protein